MPYERSGTDHITIQTELDLMKSTLPELAGANPAAALVRAVDGLENILVVWTPHIEIEQSAFSSMAIAEVMTPGEQAQVAVAFASYFSPPNKKNAYIITIKTNKVFLWAA